LKEAVEMVLQANRSLPKNRCAAANVVREPLSVALAVDETP